MAAAFPPRPAAAAAVGYRETGDEEAEAQDAVAEGGGMRAAAFDLTLPGVVLSAEEGAKTLRASDGALHRFLCPCPDQEGSAAAATATVAVRRRTSCVSIEGRVYAVRDLWPVYEEATVAQAEEQEKEEEEAAAGAGPGLEEEGPRRKRLRRLVQRRRRAVGTEIELVEPFHRRIAPEEAAVLSSLSTGGTDGGVRILAALRPVFEPTGAEGAAAGRRQWAHLLGTVPAAGAVSCLAVNPLTHHVVLGYAACGTYDILACERYRGAGEEEEKEGGAAEVVEIVE